MAAEIREQISREILMGIQQGKYAAGDRLPTEAELASHYDTSRSNVNLAMKELEQQGIIERQRRRGTFVQDAGQDQVRQVLARFQQQTTRQVHMIVADHNPPQFHWNDGALHPLEDRLRETGLLLVHETAPSELTPAYLHELVERLQLAGSHALVILADITNHAQSSQTMIDPEIIEPLLHYPGEIVLFNRSGHTLRGWPFHSVNLDPYAEGLIAARHLAADDSLKQIVFLRSNPEFDWMSLRLEGLKLGLKAAPSHRAEFIERELGANALKPESYQETLGWMETLDGPFAIVAPNDEIAGHFITQAAARGLHCPEQYRLLSFDNNPTCRRYNLTTIAPQVEELGRAVGDMICNRQYERLEGSHLSLTIGSRIIERLTWSLPQSASPILLS